jgi:hypothetical protein
MSETELKSHRPPVILLVVSITELTPADQGCIAISGSHGGVSPARYAIAARLLLSVFNDAGVGQNDAGIAARRLCKRRCWQGV